MDDRKHVEVSKKKVEQILKREMANGITLRDLKARRRVYNELVQALNSPRIAAGVRPLAPAARDNYMSRIRAFVESGGSQPLNLFGNLRSGKKIQIDDDVLNHFPNSCAVNSALRCLIQLRERLDEIA